MSHTLMPVEFAERAGVSRSTVSRALKKRLAPAFDGYRIDITHPAAQQFIAKSLARQGLTPAPIERPKLNGGKAVVEKAQLASVQAIERAKAAGAPPLDIHPALEKFVDMTLREVLTQYGTESAFKAWLTATKTIEEIQEKRLKNDEKRGVLVSRELVQTVLDAFERAFMLMLTDGSKTIAMRAQAILATGASTQDVEDLVAKQLGTFIKPAKSKAARILRSAKQQ